MHSLLILEIGEVTYQKCYTPTADTNITVSGKVIFLAFYENYFYVIYEVEKNLYNFIYWHLYLDVYLHFQQIFISL